MKENANKYDLRNILHSSKHKITFISNPKVACSTIKNSLLGGFDGDVHAEANKRFGLPQDTEHDFFCLTRNPYSRALSCFKNKIGPNKEKNPDAVWHPFCNRFGFKRDIQPSLEDFLEALLEDDDPMTMDMHYRSQHLNLHHKHIKPAFIGRIERFNEIENYLASKNIRIISRNRHKTNAMNTYTNEISQSEAYLIEKFYKEDFEIYGYTKILKNRFVPPSIFQPQHFSAEYKNLLTSDQQAT